MTIYAFEVRDYEREFFEKISKSQQINLILSEDHIDFDNLPEFDSGCGVCVLGLKEFRKKELDALKSAGVLYFSTRTIGYNHIDVEYAKQIGLHVCAASYPPNGVADYTVMMILLCLRHYKQALWRTQVNDFSLDGLMGRELKDLTVGILGTGKIGATVARNLSGFGCRLLAYDKYENTSIKDIVVYADLDALYKEADIITLHMPLFPETYHIINDESIAKMKDGVVIVNCARGALMDIDSLIRNIENEKIGALGLDCIEHEEGIIHQNLKTNIISNQQMAYLRQFKNVVHTQHMAFFTDCAIESMVNSAVLGTLDMAAGKDFVTRLC